MVQEVTKRNSVGSEQNINYLDYFVDQADDYITNQGLYCEIDNYMQQQLVDC